MDYRELLNEDDLDKLTKIVAKISHTRIDDEFTADVTTALFNRRKSIEKSDSLECAANIVAYGIRQLKESEDRALRWVREGREDELPRWFHADDYAERLGDELSSSSFWETCKENSTQELENHLVVGSRSNWDHRMAKLERECWTIDKVEWLVTMMLGKDPRKAKSVRTAQLYNQLISAIHDATIKGSKYGNKLVMCKIAHGGKIVLDPDHKWNDKSGELAARDMDWFFTQCKKATYWRTFFNKARIDQGETKGWHYRLHRRWNDSMARLTEEERAFITVYCNYDAKIDFVEQLQLLERVLHEIDGGEFMKTVKIPMSLEDFDEKENKIGRDWEDSCDDIHYDELVS